MGVYNRHNLTEGAELLLPVVADGDEPGDVLNHYERRREPGTIVELLDDIKAMVTPKYAGAILYVLERVTARKNTMKSCPVTVDELIINSQKLA